MATANTKAARERKQKIFVAVGGLVLLLLLAIQLPKFLGGSSETASTTTTTATDTVGGATPEVVPTGVPVALSDTDRPLGAAPGKLPSLAVFKSKDPFVQQVKTPTAATPTATSPPATTGEEKPKPSDSGGGGNGNKGPDSPEPPSQGFSVGQAAAAVTVISVNGARQVLVPGAAFPSTNPVFVLVAEQPRTKTVRIGIAGGAYENGAKATKLQVGKPLVLVNTATGARYKLVLVSVGNGSAVAKASDKTSDKPSD